MKKIAKMLYGISCVLACMVLALTGSVCVKAAGTHKVTITTANYNGGKAIQEALNLQQNNTYDKLEIVISPGTYNITEALTVYSNTSIDATGATLKYIRETSKEGSDGRAPMLSNYASGKKGYTGAGNISVNGGTWDFQGKKGEVNYGVSMEAVRFMHGSNYTVTNMTLQNLYTSHYLTVEGVENVTIQNCVFKACTAPKLKKEALHIDIMHNDDMAPSNQVNTIYDDSYCNNITVTGCTFDSVPRGVGTHIAVAGLYPSGINISNNTFTNITYEAIKAYHYNNVTIANNKITNAGFGIKAYLYAEPDDEKESNYLPALKGTKTEGVPANLNVLIKGNIVQNITSSGNGFGIHVAGNSSRIMNGVTVETNTVTTTKMAGIYTTYVNSVKLLSNKVTASGKTGFLISNCSNITATGNVVSDSKETGILTQFSKNMTLSGNTVTNSAKHSIYLNKTTGAKVLSNITNKDKKTGICADAGCNGVEISGNKIQSAGKNGIIVISSPSSKVLNNQVLTTKNMGIYVSKSNNTQITGNTVNNVKTTGIVAQSSTGIKVKKNTVDKTGKFGILFQKTKKSNASKNKISGTKQHAILYTADSKNKKTNIKIRVLLAKKGKKVVTGSVYGKQKITVTVDGKAKSKKSKSNGQFSIKTKKLKKGTKVKVQVTDSLGNVYTKTVKAK